jgi:hypothetical protein
VPAGPCVPVAGELDEVDLVRDRERPGEVGKEDEARLQERDEQEVPVGIVGPDLLAQLADARPELLGAEKDLADMGVVRG